MHSPIRYSNASWSHPDRITIAHPKPEAVFMLEHSSTCKKEVCPNSWCKDMRKTIEHSKKCDQPIEIACERCMQVLSWTMWHSHGCNRHPCPVHCCENIREKHKTK